MSPAQLVALASILVAALAIVLAVVAIRKIQNAAERAHERLAERERPLGQARDRPSRLDGELLTRPGGDGERSAAAAKADQITRLASQGVDAVEIARRMKMDVGEVKLTINLHKYPPVSS